RELGEYLELLPQKKGRAPRLDPEMERLVSRVEAMQGDVRDALVRIAYATKSYAAMLYHAAGVELIDLARYAAHGRVDFTPAVPAGARLALVFHNDNYTTMEVVVGLLVEIVGLPQAEAERLMLEVHHNGRAQVAVLPAARAVELAHEILRIVGENNYPLRVSL